ncbi:helix-turn-helix transcriptional regulator [Paenibacillus cymbidii]|uniref:helix-turn-helix transcriptional regulator n=1 Tax=Paenibacillus cymbidii TaxID=1639034 RepID=UPI00107FE439|nr:AraC family transcriptional regulator [Paenibacillus cymbidii]
MNPGEEKRAWHLFNELSEHMTLRINSCRLDGHDAKWKETKQHPDYDMWFVQEGEIHLELGGETGVARSGDAILFYPNTRYTAWTGAQGCRFVYVHFDFAIGGNPHSLNGFELAGIIPETAIREETALFLRAFACCERQEPLSGIKLKGCLTLVLAAVIERGARAAEAPGTAETDSGASRHMKAMQPLFAYIHDNLHRPIAIRELAEMAGMSEKYLIRVFKTTVGITPGHYMQQVRMNRAREYVHRRTYTVKQIAELLGYPDPYTFSKAFKKYYRTPPSRFD